MLHAREFTLSRVGISLKQIGGHNQTENGITEELERLVVKIARVALRPRGNLFVSPGTVSHRLRQQSLIAKAILQNLFQLIQVFQAAKFHKELILTKRRTQRRKGRCIRRGCAKFTQFNGTYLFF